MDVEKIVKGEAKYLDYPEGSFYNEFIYQFSMLRYSNYGLLWYEKEAFDLSFDDINHIALFNLAIYRHDDTIIELFEEDEYVLERDNRLLPMIYGALDEFPVPTEKMIRYLHERTRSSPSWQYYVTGWCIMSNLRLDGLKYCEDHLNIAKRCNKEWCFEGKKFELSIGIVLMTGQYYINFDEEYSLNIDYQNKKIYTIEPTLDNACLMTTHLKEYPMNYRDI